MTNSDEIVHLIDDSAVLADEVTRRWKIAVIDDDPAVHDGTRFALSDYNLNGQGLEILSAYSAAEGRELIRQNPDIAAILLDVIMETDDAGLKLVSFIRDELKNEATRIILRTGQPGQAPERRVIVDYDINDYKAKTELTADKLFTSLTAALRSYQQIMRMVETRRGLEIIIDAASTLFDFSSMQRLAEGVLTQIASLLNADCSGILVLREQEGAAGGFSVLAGSGCYRNLIGSQGRVDLDTELRSLVEEAFRRRRHDFLPKRSALYVQTASAREVVVLIEAARSLSDTDRTLVEIFASRLSLAFDNVILYQQLQEANSRLEERVEQRTRDLTAANARLMAQWSRLRQANAFKSEIVGKIAHDLKNPLAVILGRTEIFRELAASSLESAQAQIGHIQTAAGRLAGMVDSLIADAMADALDISIRMASIDLAALVREVAESNIPLAARKQQTIAVSVASRPAQISCDGDRMREAVDNLISNAIKYSPLGARIDVSVEQEKDVAVISVKDEGPGFSPEDMSRLFGRFQRLSAKPTAGESSTGLGLSIVKRIVDLHQGHLAVEPAESGRGSAMVITLPVT
jgi:signal transduction histidine kinase